MVTQLDDRSRLEHPGLIEDQLTMLKRINVALDEQQVRTTLHGQEAFTGNIDSMSILEVLDRGTSSSFELTRY